MATKFEEYLETQSDEVKKDYAEHVKGLKSALDAERGLHKAAKERATEIETSAAKQIETLTADLNAFKTAEATAKAQLQEKETVVSTLQGTIKKLHVNAAIVSEATMRNFEKPEDAIALIKDEDIKFADDGKPVNVKELVENLAKDRAYLIKKAVGTPVPPTPDGTQPKQPQAVFPVI